MKRSPLDIWGPFYWKFIHFSAFNYPDTPSLEQQQGAKDFYNNLQWVIPCHECSEHYSKMVINNPPDTSSRDNLVKWTVKIHNLVNFRLGAEQYDYNKVVETFENKGNINIKLYCVMIAIFLLIITLVAFYVLR